MAISVETNCEFLMESWVLYNELLLIYSLDVLSLDSDQQTLSVYNWNHGSCLHHSLVLSGLRTRLVPENFAYQQGAQIKHSSKVLNVVPGDFTHSGKLDLLIMGQGQKSREIDMYLYQSIPNKGFGEGCATRISQ